MTVCVYVFFILTLHSTTLKNVSPSVTRGFSTLDHIKGVIRLSTRGNDDEKERRSRGGHFVQKKVGSFDT